MATDTDSAGGDEVDKPAAVSPRVLGRKSWQEPFLEKLAVVGTVAEACRLVGVSRALVYSERQASPSFAAAWDKACDAAVGLVEAEVMSRGWYRHTQMVVRTTRYPSGKVVTTETEKWVKPTRALTSFLERMRPRYPRRPRFSPGPLRCLRSVGRLQALQDLTRGRQRGLLRTLSPQLAATSPASRAMGLLLDACGLPGEKERSASRVASTPLTLVESGFLGRRFARARGFSRRHLGRARRRRLPLRPASTAAHASRCPT